MGSNIRKLLLILPVLFVVISCWHGYKERTAVKNLTLQHKTYQQIKKEFSDSPEMMEQIQIFDKFLDSSLPLNTAFQIENESFGLEVIENFLKESGTMDFKGKYLEKLQLIYQAIRRNVLIYVARKSIQISEDKLNKEVEYQKKISLTDNFFAKNIDEAIVPTEEELLAYFEKHQKEFVKQEKLDLSQIIVPEEKQAQAIYEQILNGISFETLAKENSTDSTKSQGGKIGWVSSRKLSPPFDQMVKTLLTGEVCTPAKCEFGYRILKLNNRDISYFTFEEAKGFCDSEIRRVKAGELFSEVMTDLKEDFNVSVNKEVLAKMNYSRVIPEELTGKEVLASIKGNDFTVNEWYERLRRNPDKSIKAMSEEAMDKEKYLMDLVEQKLVVLRGTLRKQVQEKKMAEDSRDSYLMNRLVENYKAEHPEIYLSEDSSEEERMKYYEENKDKYFVPHQFSLILLKKDKKEELVPLYEKALKGEDFELLAEENSSGDFSGRVIKIFKKNLAEELVKEIEKLSPNQLSPIISAPDGFYLVKMFENIPAYQRSYKDVERDLLKVIPTRRRTQHFENYVNELMANYQLKINPIFLDHLESFDTLSGLSIEKR